MSSNPKHHFVAVRRVMGKDGAIRLLGKIVQGKVHFYNHYADIARMPLGCTMHRDTASDCPSLFAETVRITPAVLFFN